MPQNVASSTRLRLSDRNAPPRRPLRPLPLQKAFSLVEILVVMAIIGIIVSFGLPALSSIGASKGVTQAAYDVSALLEFARAEAVARQTYVWVGIQPEQRGPTTVLRMGAVYSKDGTPSVAANYQPLTRPLLVQGVTITDFSALKPSTQAALSPTGTTVSTEAVGHTDAAFKIGSVDFGSSQGTTITFTPRGEAMLKGNPTTADGFDPLIGMGLRQVRGTAIPADADDAGVVLDGSVGLPRIVRQN